MDNFELESENLHQQLAKEKRKRISTKRKEANYWHDDEAQGQSKVSRASRIP